jgi:hypothetical protein
MRAVRANGKEIIARTNKQRLFAADPPEQHTAVAQGPDADALAKIRLS